MLISYTHTERHRYRECKTDKIIKYVLLLHYRAMPCDRGDVKQLKLQEKNLVKLVNETYTFT